MPLITLEQISLVREGRAVLRDISWEVGENEQWGIVGPNGSGKTLLMQIVRGRLPYSSGMLSYSHRITPSYFAYVSFELHSQIIAREQGLEYARNFSASEDEGTTVQQLLEDTADLREQTSTETIRTLGLEHFLTTPLLALSNGEMRKVLLCRALLKKPRILILDEPYDGLDGESRFTLGKMIEHLPAKHVQVLLITQHREDLSASITHILGLKDGQIVLKGPKHEVEHSSTFKDLFDVATRKVVPPNIPIGVSHNPNAAKTADEPTAVMNDVTVSYGARVVLNKFNWTVRRNEHWAIIGPNGCGKSTLLRLISADHLQAYSNNITLFGKHRGSGESIWDIKQRIGVLSPELQILYREDLTVSQVVASGFFDSVGLYQQTTIEQKSKVQEWLKILDLQGDQKFSLLSYGLRRTVMLARALVKGPEMLLLDEPCQGLDKEHRQRLIELVSTIPSVTGAQIIFVTHRRDEFPQCISHVLEFAADSGQWSNRAVSVRARPAPDG